MEIVNPEQWAWVWSHYVRRTMCRGAESLSTTTVILVAKTRMVIFKQGHCYFKHVPPFCNHFVRAEARMLSLLARLHVFSSKSKLFFSRLQYGKAQNVARNHYKLFQSFLSLDPFKKNAWAQTADWWQWLFQSAVFAGWSDRSVISPAERTHAEVQRSMPLHLSR